MPRIAKTKPNKKSLLQPASKISKISYKTYIFPNLKLTNLSFNLKTRKKLTSLTSFYKFTKYLEVVQVPYLFISRLTKNQPPSMKCKEVSHEMLVLMLQLCRLGSLAF